MRARAKEILGSIDFYEVGHHGSTNATPMDVVKAMKAGCGRFRRNTTSSSALTATWPSSHSNPSRIWTRW